MPPGTGSADAVTRPAVEPRVAAFRTARRRFLAGDRVTVSGVAAEVGVDRVTLHRWLGNRTQLLTELVWSLSGPEVERCYAEASGRGGLRVADALSRHVADLCAHPGFRAFLENEHELALRLLTRRDHAFQARLVALVQDLLERERAAGHPVPDHPLDDLAYLAVRVLESFVYVEQITGEVPDPERAARALRFLLR